ncbi:protein of unknown function [Cupriavidus taiwanensis]|uniref:Uncharacterized protein n=1 Tax=Cupriavidus taiwanensis TaxID=164546 RepID=A0A9Q7UMY8_9BURK|nr:protein of unknown function [Cupriavidus taiwanensis]
MRHGAARLLPRLLKKLGIRAKKSEKSRQGLVRRKYSLKIKWLQGCRLPLFSSLPSD